jgi:hypothetical protein
MNFTRQQWIILGVLGFLLVAVLCIFSLLVVGGALIPPTPTDVPPFVFPATWTPAPTPTMIVP